MDQMIHDFDFWEGDLAGDGHNQVRHTTLHIVTQPQVDRADLLGNLETNLRSLGFEIGELFSQWSAQPTESDAQMVSQLRDAGWLRYVRGLNSSGVPSHTQALILSAYYMPVLLSTLLLVRPDGSFIGGTGGFDTSRTSTSWGSRTPGTSSDLNDLLGAGTPINYSGPRRHETALHLAY